MYMAIPPVTAAACVCCVRWARPHSAFQHQSPEGTRLCWVTCSSTPPLAHGSQMKPILLTDKFTAAFGAKLRWAGAPPCLCSCSLLLKVPSFQDTCGLSQPQGSLRWWLYHQEIPPHGNPNLPEPSAPGGAILAPMGPRPHPSVLRRLRPRSACARVAELRLSLPLGACGQGSCISGRSCRLQAWPCAWRLCGCGCRK